jgi:alkylation response protein AidB-like acyl-CoA dehydrogenase
MLLGIADTALESSRQYALEREQFGVPIGSFQAVQHMLADMYVRTALARSALYAGAAVLDDPEIGDPMDASAVAKLLAGEAAVENARTAIQVHGGMGFTWEMLPNYLLKRAWVLEHTFGNADSHALALGTRIEEMPA